MFVILPRLPCAPPLISRTGKRPSSAPSSPPRPLAPIRETGGTQSQRRYWLAGVALITF